ncbi:uncharacterized protein PgNI_02729 [Pyricularia grisea]|uniref:Uncharacterized protein n=1 Tax=Pyricularia grisea TaxID=148305 RepID=A0A6P8B8Y9_PYRGI|nr:uncharacterized protein PgNI_02729 [Pyricularia grisea]TLD12293.1 hypothetical protein PgNI_02729 [Pyricularia grisea]
MQYDKLVDESEMQLQDAARNVALAKAIRKLGKQYREAIINVHIWANLKYCEKSLKNLHFMQFLRLAQSYGEKETKKFAKGYPTAIIEPVSIFLYLLAARLTIPIPPIGQQVIFASPISQPGLALTLTKCFKPRDIPSPTNYNPSDANIPKLYYIGFIWDFENLQPEFQNILRLLVFVGGWAPEILFTGISKQWGSNGELESLVEKTPTPQEVKLNLKFLKQKTCVLSAVESQTIYLVNPIVFKSVEAHTPNKAEWKRRAIDTVFRVFPTDYYMEPINFTQIVRAITPCLNRVLCYFFKGTTTEHPKRLVRVCRAASLFRDSAWKIFLTRIASQVATSFKNNQLAVEIGFRQVSLSRSTYKEYFSVGLDAGIKSLDIRCAYGNAIFGKALLSEARARLFNCKGHQSVEKALSRFRFFTGTSTLEKYIFVESELLLATSLRHEGKFKEAGERFFGLFNKVYPSNFRIFSAWNEIQCELGFVSQATNFLVSEYLSFRLNPFSSGGKRHLLAIANVYFMEALWEKYKNITVNFRSFSAAKSIFSSFRDLPCSNISANHSLFAVLSGFGIINLMRLEWVAALSYWKEAVNVANQWLRNHKSARMVVLYAQSEIYFRLGDTKAHNLATKSGKLFLEHGRHYQFIGHGSIWLDVLGNYAQKCGRPRMAPIFDQNISAS